MGRVVRAALLPDDARRLLDWLHALVPSALDALGAAAVPETRTMLTALCLVVAAFASGAEPVPARHSAVMAQAPTPPPPRLPGIVAPALVIQALRDTLAQAVQRFEARDLAGVLAHVSDQYWTGPLTKATIRAQLLAVFQLYDAVQARVRIDDVRMVGEHAWIYSTGEVSGRLPILGSWMTLYAWERELEVARREGKAWRLFGYQQ
ncbi:MAG: hypothetical protein ACRELA_08885 [Candidatus Rokuibacteriota bacterium]